MDYRLEQLRFELREDPSSRIFFKLGEHLRREGELDEAVEVLRTGIKEHPRYVAAWVSLGRAQLDNGDAEGAREALDRALQLDPENAVAARAMGEAAIKTNDWVTAVKALKRARGLSPQDDELDERIAFVEARLAELGLLKQPPPNNAAEVAAADDSPPAAETVKVPVEAPVEDPVDAPVEGPVEASVEETVEEPFEVRSAGDTGEWDDSDDVFAAGQVADESPAEAPAEAAGEDPSPVDEPDENDVDSGAFAEPLPLTDDDVSSMVDGDEAPLNDEPAVIVHEEEPFEDEAADPQEAAFVAPEPEALPESEPEPVVEHEGEPAPDPVVEVAPEPLPESWPDPEPEAVSELEKDANGLPLPTMTLARLAIDQGDLDLAERTLRGVLEREPGHSEAAELLETVVAGPPHAPATTSSDPSDARAEALQRWLDAVRLASERLKT